MAEIIEQPKVIWPDDEPPPHGGTAAWAVIILGGMVLIGLCAACLSILWTSVVG